MLDDLIRRIIKVAIGSFPINERKKTELLRILLDQKDRGGAKNHVLH